MPLLQETKLFHEIFMRQLKMVALIDSKLHTMFATMMFVVYDGDLHENTFFLVILFVTVTASISTHILLGARIVSAIVFTHFHVNFYNYAKLSITEEKKFKHDDSHNDARTTY